MQISLKNKVIDLLQLADIKVNGNRPHDIQIHDERFYSRVIVGGSLALGESYMDREWDCEKLDTFFQKLMTAEIQDKVKNINNMMYFFKAYFRNMQDRKGSQKVIDTHYDLGNDLYEAFLDKRMLYTCGYWNGSATSLDDSQEAKLKITCEKLHLKAGMKVLEIGCGWGGFAKYAAQNYGVEVTGATISKNQKAYAESVCKDLSVNIVLQDYRDLQGQYDAIVVMGMIEHVGFKNYKALFDVAARCLKPTGLFLLHTIGDHEPSPFGDPWSHKYIFPNSSLPSLSQLEDSAKGSFVMEDLQNFGRDYYLTLKAWHDKFLQNWDSLKDNYDDRFHRMWVYYLLSFAGSFEARNIQLWQIVFSKGELPRRIYQRKST